MSLLIYSICISEVEEDTDSIQPPPQKKLRPSLFAHYTDSVPEPEDNGRLEKLLSHYIDTVNAVSFDCDTKLADICRQKEFQPLAYLFESILTVPASSAAVERKFSKSGLIARPHRAKMSDKLLESLMCAKCSLK